MKTFLISIEKQHPDWIKDASAETRALFFLGLYHLTQRKSYLAKAKAAVNEALKSFDMKSSHWGLLDSPAQALWIARLLGEPADQHALLFEARLARGLPLLKNHDVLYGLVGLGNFLLTLPPEDSLRAFLPEVISRIKAQRREPGVWVDFERPRAKQINLGFAHGLPGLTAFFASTEDRAEVRALVKSLELHDQENYPSKVFPTTHARQAWCYGAPGVALGLASAAKVLKQSSSKAVKLFERGSAQAELDDPFVCHGSSGLALIGYALKAPSTDAWMQRTYDELKVLKMKRGSTNLLTSPLGAALVLITQETGWTEWAEPLLIPNLKGSGSRVARSAKRSPALRRQRRAAAD